MPTKKIGIIVIVVALICGVVVLTISPRVEKDNDTKVTQSTETEDGARPSTHSPKEDVNEVRATVEDIEPFELVKSLDSLTSFEQQQMHAETERYVSQYPLGSYVRWRPVIINEDLQNLTAPFSEDDFPETLRIDVFDDLQLVAERETARVHDESRILSWRGTVSGATPGRVEVSVGRVSNNTQFFLKIVLGESLNSQVFSISPINNEGSVYVVLEGKPGFAGHLD